jgi:hypothetical protein
VESVVGGVPVDLIGTNEFNPSPPGAGTGSLQAENSAAIATGVGAPVRIHTAITVAVWLRRNASQNNNTTLVGPRISSSNESGNVPWELGMNNSDTVRIVWHEGDHNSVVSTAASATALDTWEHWSFTRPEAGTSCKIYKNGVIVGTEFTGLTKSTGSTAVGVIAVGQFGNLGNEFQGSLFSAIVYEEELSAAQVLALYNSTSSDGSWA